MKQTVGGTGRDGKVQRTVGFIYGTANALFHDGTGRYSSTKGCVAVLVVALAVLLLYVVVLVVIVAV